MKKVFSLGSLSATLLLLLSMESSAQWVQTIGPYGGHVRAFAVSGTNLFTGTETGGVFLSTNSGTSWTRVIAGLTDTSAIALAASGTNLFAGTYGGGVFLSTNSGTSWNPVHSGLTNDSVQVLAVSGTDLFAGTNGGVFRSTNSGTSWSQVYNGLPSTMVRAFFVNGTNLLVGTQTDGIFRSTNSGSSWTPVAGFPSTTVYAFAMIGPNLFAGTGSGVFLSINSGANWSSVNDGLTRTDVEALAVSGTNLFAGTYGGGVFLSTNSGTNWTPFNVGLTSTVVRALAVSGTNLFAGTDGGVYRYSLDIAQVTSEVVYVTTVAGIKQICTINTDGSNFKALTAFTTDYPALYRPSYSPDGTKIAFWLDQGSANNVWIMNSDGSGMRQLTFANEMFAGDKISFSPRSDVLYYRRTVTPGEASIWKVGSNGQNNGLFYDFPGNEYAIDFIGDSYLMYYVNGGGIYRTNSLVDLNSSLVIALGEVLSVNPSLTKVAFRTLSEYGKLKIADINGSSPIVLADEGSGTILTPSFTGDEQYVVYNVDGQIKIVKTDGTGLRTITTGFNPMVRPGVVNPVSLAAPIRLSPVNGASNQALPVTFRWMPVAGASTYQLQVSTAANFATVIVNDSTLTDTLKQVSGLANSTTYYWRVRARTPVQIGLFPSSGFMFTTRPVDTPLLLGEYQRDANTALLLHLDEASGSSVLDASGNYNDGRLSGVSRLTGRFGSGIKLPTTVTDSGIVVPKSPTVNISSPMTVECWYKTSAYDVEGVNLITNRSWYALFLGSSSNMGYLQFFYPVGGSWSVYQSNTQIPLGRWTHLAGVWDGGTPVLYIDGVLIPGQVIQQGPFGADQDVVFIGSHWNQGAVSTSVTVIDEIRVSNKARAPQEFNVQLPPKNLLVSSNTTTVSLSWQNGGGMVPLMRYRVYRGTDSATVNLIDSTVSTAYVNSGLGTGTTYYYRISAVDSTGFESARSEVKGATTLTLLPPPLVQPADNSTGQAPSVIFRWRSATQALRYHIQISCSPSFLWYSENDSTTTDTVRTVSGLAYNTTYYWRVAAIGLGGRSAFASQAFRFKTRDTLAFVSSAVHNFSSWQAPTDYRLLSFPGTTNFTLAQLLTGTQKTEWRVYEDNGGTPPSHLSELDANGTIAPGKGYWMLRQGNLTFSRTVTMPGLDTNGAYAIPLRIGWNLIGNPLDKAVSWDAVRQANGLITANLSAYGGSTGFQSSLQMEPFKGYYFYNATGLPSLKFPYPFAGRPAKVSSEPALLWKVQIAFETSHNKDLENVAGVASSNAVDIESHNQRKPPSFKDQASLYFNLPENDGSLRRFSTDFRPSIGEGTSWDFEVHNPLLSDAVIHLVGVESIPAEFEVCLISRSNSRPNDMRKNPTFVYQTVAEKMSFRLIVGKQGFVDNQVANVLPREFRLDQNYPNPFNPTTTITFSVPRVANIQLEVFSPLGQRVVMLADGLWEPGVFTVTWNGANVTGSKVASGTYFCCLVVDGRLVDTKAMVLMK